MEFTFQRGKTDKFNINSGNDLCYKEYRVKVKRMTIRIRQNV